MLFLVIVSTFGVVGGFFSDFFGVCSEVRLVDLFLVFLGE